MIFHGYTPFLVLGMAVPVSKSIGDMNYKFKEVRKMDRAKWIKLSDEILKHLKAIRRILKQNGIDNLSMAFFKDTNSWATHIDNDDNRWEMRITPNEVEELVDDGFKFYTKM